MCMIGCALTNEYGVLASDSAMANSDDITFFEVPKLFKYGKYLATFIGNTGYLSGLSPMFFEFEMKGTSIHLQTYLRNVRQIVKNRSEKENMSDDFLIYVLGVQDGMPTLLILNSRKNFDIEYLSKKDSDKVTFANIYYGDDSEKSQIFQDSHEYLKSLVDHYETISPGILAEILTRGIYYKSDQEKKRLGKKWAGGAVSASFIRPNGIISHLTNIH